MYKLSVIVIDKLIGLGGTIYTWVLIFVSYLCTIKIWNYKKYNTHVCMYTVIESHSPIKWMILHQGHYNSLIIAYI